MSSWIALQTKSECVIADLLFLNIADGGVWINGNL